MTYVASVPPTSTVVLGASVLTVDIQVSGEDIDTDWKYAWSLHEYQREYMLSSSWRSSESSSTRHQVVQACSDARSMCLGVRTTFEFSFLLARLLLPFISRNIEDDLPQLLDVFLGPG